MVGGCRKVVQSASRIGWLWLIGVGARSIIPSTAVREERTFDACGGGGRADLGRRGVRLSRCRQGRGKVKGRIRAQGEGSVSPPGRRSDGGGCWSRELAQQWWETRAEHEREFLGTATSEKCDKQPPPASTFIYKYAMVIWAAVPLCRRWRPVWSISRLSAQQSESVVNIISTTRGTLYLLLVPEQHSTVHSERKQN